MAPKMMTASHWEYRRSYRTWLNNGVICILNHPERGDVPVTIWSFQGDGHDGMVGKPTIVYNVKEMVTEAIYPVDVRSLRTPIPGEHVRLNKALIQSGVVPGSLAVPAKDQEVLDAQAFVREMMYKDPVRLEACWNACQGVDLDQLEEYALFHAEKELAHLTEKITHGCTDHPCRECDRAIDLRYPMPAPTPAPAAE